MSVCVPETKQEKEELPLLSTNYMPGNIHMVLVCSRSNYYLHFTDDKTKTQGTVQLAWGDEVGIWTQVC